MAGESQSPEQLVLNIGSAASFSRDDLIVTPANVAAVHLIDVWPNWITPVSIIVGPSGTGKTHLVTAWRAKSGASIFGSTDLKAAAQRARDGHAIAIDDIEQEAIDEVALFHLINTVREAGAYLLMTSTVAFDLGQIKTPDLASRLRAATSIAMEVPDDDLLRAVFAKLFADRQLSVDPGVIDYCLARIPRSLQSVVDFVDRLDRASMSRKRRITSRFAGEVLDNVTSQLPL
ncbi:MAG: hypothetical protein AAFY99_03325 [Pseudomonadota bacterium]